MGPAFDGMPNSLFMLGACGLKPPLFKVLRIMPSAFSVIWRRNLRFEFLEERCWEVRKIRKVHGSVIGDSASYGSSASEFNVTNVSNLHTNKIVNICILWLMCENKNMFYTRGVFTFWTRTKSNLSGRMSMWITELMLHECCPDWSLKDANIAMIFIVSFN